jgi:hypothetical protein
MNTFCTHLVVDLWEGSICKNETISDPTHDDVEKLIRALDVNTHTIATLYGPNRCHLSVGGGAGVTLSTYPR